MKPKWLGATPPKEANRFMTSSPFSHTRTYTHRHTPISAHTQTRYTFLTTESGYESQSPKEASRFPELLITCLDIMHYELYS